jgi:hypothetical protein
MLTADGFMIGFSGHQIDSKGLREGNARTYTQAGNKERITYGSPPPKASKNLLIQ